NLDLQAEVNIARPFTYSHESNQTSYAHYNQALAHPVGANFREFVGIARYQALKKLNLTAKLIVTEYGTDSTKTGASFGKDVTKSYNQRIGDYGFSIGSGIKTQLLYLDFTASYQLKQNLFIDFRQLFRRLESDLSSQNNSAVVTSLALRLNIAPREQVF
ncbi:MAG: hypothetical protein H7Y04_02735, partial [Verrucomicrobia bacterium]|nr:hypothetical protein [Cytophagales bacterium]